MAEKKAFLGWDMIWARAFAALALFLPAQGL
jgi:hypothetical protein